MSILPKIYTLKEEAQAQLYEWFDKEIHSSSDKPNLIFPPSRLGTNVPTDLIM